MTLISMLIKLLVTDNTALTKKTRVKNVPSLFYHKYQKKTDIITELDRFAK